MQVGSSMKYPCPWVGDEPVIFHLSQWPSGSLQSDLKENAKVSADKKWLTMHNNSRKRLDHMANNFKPR